MPKRKSEEDYDKLFKKIKKLEKKLRRRCRSRSRSKSSDNCHRSESQGMEPTASDEACEIVECDVTELLDGNVNLELGAHPERQADCSAEVLLEPAESLAAAVDADPHANAPLPTNPCDDSGTTDPVLDNAILEILGDDPTISNNYGPEIHKDLAIRLEHLVSHGLTREHRKELNEKYLLPSNCKLINAPELNAEIKVAISDMTAKRDKNIENRQKQIGTAIACLSGALNKLITNNTSDRELINLLMDSQRILCDSQYSDSVIRRNFILSALKKDMKDQLQNTKPDNLLFGQNLTDTIKTAKAINKSGAELKTPLPKPQTNNKKATAIVNNNRNLNWKGPYPARRQQNVPKKKEPPPNRNRQSSSSRPLQQQQPARGRR